MKRQIVYLFVGFFLVAALITPPKLLAGPYYEGKVITLIVGFPVGGGFDQMFRLVARHLPKHIPGKPSLIVVNMPGGDSIIAANQLYSVVKPDGLTIGGVSKALPFAQLLKVEGIKFDLTKFAWLCSVSVESSLFNIRSDLPYKTIQDLQKAEKTIFIADHGPTAYGTQLSHMIVTYFKLNAKLVSYKSTAEIVLAFERKEADAVTLSPSAAMPYIARGLMRPLTRTKISQKGIENIPVDVDLISDEMGKTVMSVLASAGQNGKPFIAPPGTPADVLNILRDAFAKAIKDPALLADAQKSLMEVEYVSPEDCLRVVSYILNQPPEIVKEFSKYVRF